MAGLEEVDVPVESPLLRSETGVQDSDGGPLSERSEAYIG